MNQLATQQHFGDLRISRSVVDLRRYLVDVCYRRSLDALVGESKRFKAKSVPVDLLADSLNKDDCRVVLGTITVLSTVLREDMEGVLRQHNARQVDPHQAFTFFELYGGEPRFVGNVFRTGVFRESERLHIERELTFEPLMDGTVLPDLAPTELWLPGTQLLVRFPYLS